MRCGRWTRILAGLAPALLPCMTDPALAQQGGGLSASLTYSEQLVLQNEDASLRSNLGFSYSSITRRQRLVLNFGAGVDKSVSDGLNGDLIDPRVTLSYGLESRDAALSFDARYRRTEISRLSEFELSEDQTVLVVDDGDQETTSMALGLEFGRTARFGGTVRLRHAETRYIDILSPDVLDSDTSSAALSLRFEVDPRITLRLPISVSELDRKGGVDTRTERIGMGVTLAVDKTRTFDVDLGVSRIEESGTAARSTSEQAFYSLALVQEQSNGTLSGTLNSDANENGRRTTLRFDRALDLPRAQVNVGLGASRDEESGEVDPLYALGYNWELPRGSFRVNLQQAFSTDTAGNETLNSRIRLALSQELNPSSRLTTRFNLNDTAARSDGADDSRQIDLGVDYNRALTRDWSLVTGYSHIWQDLSDGTKDTDDRLYLGLQLNRSWRP